jgi:hypothetical protein
MRSKPFDHYRITRAASCEGIRGGGLGELEDLDLAKTEHLGTVALEGRAAGPTDDDHVPGPRQQQCTVRVSEIAAILEQSNPVVIFDEETRPGIESCAQSLTEGLGRGQTGVGFQQIPCDPCRALARLVAESPGHLLDDGKGRADRWPSR